MQKKSKKTAKKSASKLIPVVVCTEFRGVFFGYVDPKTINGERISLERARNCLYWAKDIDEKQRGVFALASVGPRQGCRVGPAVDMPRLDKITCVVQATHEAAKAWEAQPWS